MFSKCQLFEADEFKLELIKSSNWQFQNHLGETKLDLISLWLGSFKSVHKFNQSTNNMIVSNLI